MQISDAEWQVMKIIWIARKADQYGFDQGSGGAVRLVQVNHSNSFWLVWLRKSV